MTTSNIRVGQNLRLTVRFADFDFSNGTDELLDPTNVSLALYKIDSATPHFISNLSPIVQDAQGIYHYDWITPSDGKFQLEFTGTILGATPSIIKDTRIFYVGTSTPTIILNEPKTFYFLGELDPLYLDPEEILMYLTSSNMSDLNIDIVEITESIYRASLQVEEWFGSGVEITSQIRDYIVAAVLCDLSKSYSFGGLIHGTGGGFTLGDLTIDNPAVSLNTTKSNIYDGNVTTWCQLTYILKNALLRSKVTYLPVVKGSAYINPIPMRQLRRFD